MGNFCYTCKKKLLWGQKKFPYSDIIEVFPTVVPVGLTSKDILCTDCIHDLANQDSSDHEKTNTKNNTEVMPYSGNYDDVDGLYEEALDLANIDDEECIRCYDEIIGINSGEGMAWRGKVLH